MSANVQTWIALVIVAITATWLLVRAWRRRGTHEGCDCPGAKANPDLAKLKKRAR